MDDVQSGIALDRPGLGRLRKKVTAGELDSVSMTEPERLSRDYRQLRSLSEELQEAGCQVHFLDALMQQQPVYQPSTFGW